MVLMNNHLHSPLISAGIFGGNLPNPVAESTKQCCRAYNPFINTYPEYDIDVILCAYGSNEYSKARTEFKKWM
ncbi:MAG: hypothetical protein HUJ53_09050 [Holdemanella sp.]|nr:hypothetical protein [Holdemanella sp.]